MHFALYPFNHLVKPQKALVAYHAGAALLWVL